MPSIHESIRNTLLQHERSFWATLISADVPAMENLCKPDANFLFPRRPIVALDEGEPSLQDVVHPPFHQFDYYSLGDARMIVLGLTAGVITYQITAAQGDEMYNATGSSTWSQDVDGQWRLACHQETLL